MSKPIVELLGFEWTKRPKFKYLLAKPDSGKPSFHEYSGNRDHRNQFIEMSPLQDTYYTSDNVCDFQRGFYSLFVYCDIAKDAVFRDVKTLLL